MANIPELTKRFFTDPQWGEVEELILGYVMPLLDFDTLDTTQPAEHVKAEVIARKLAYNAMTKFLKDTSIITRPVREIKNPFK